MPRERTCGLAGQAVLRAAPCAGTGSRPTTAEDVGNAGWAEGDGARRQPAGCMCGEVGASSDETDCTETALSDDGTGPSQCLVERCSSAVCFCPHGLPLGKGTGQRWVGARAVGVRAAPEGTPHARVPGFVESLGSRYLIRLGGRSCSFGFRAAWGSSTARLSTLTAGVPQSWGWRRGQIRRRCTRVRDMSCTGAGLKSRRDVLPTERNLVEAIGQRPRVVPD